VSFTFSEPVTGFGAGSVTVTGGSLTSFSGSGTSYSATFVPAPGSFGTATLQVAAGAFSDAAGNPNAASNTVGVPYDTAIPSVVSFTSANSTPTNVSSVGYTLTFSEGVTGITSGDFSNTGTATGCAYAVSGSGTTYTVTVSGCSEGTIIPRFAANGGTDTAGNTGPSSNSTATSTVTRDTTVPSVTGFTSDDSLTNDESIEYTITFSEDVSDLTPEDFSNSGTATGCTFVVSGSGDTYTITVSGCSEGTITPSFDSGGATDDAGNSGPASDADASTTVTRDTTAPSVIGFTSGESSTNDASVEFTLTFSESVTGLTAEDFSNSGSATGCTFAVSGSGTTYTVTVSGCSEGTIIPSFDSGSATDAAGNAGPTSDADATTTVTRDTTAPTVTGFTSSAATPTNSETISYTLTFSESVTGVLAGDFSNAGSALGCSFAPGSDSGTTRTVLVSGCSSGTVTPVFTANGATDAAGNTGPASDTTATTTITRDTSVPGVTGFTSTQSTPTNASSIEYTITFSKSVSGVTLGDFSNTGTATGCSFAVSGSGTSYTVTVSGCSAGTIIPRFAADGGTDTAGNTGPASAATATDTITRDTTAPTVTGFTSTQSTPTNASSIEYTITFSKSVTGVVSGDFTNTGTATGCSFAVSGSGSSYTVTVSGCSAGTIIPSFDSDGATDAAGNTGPASAATATDTITRDTTAPTVTGFTSSESSPTTSDSIEYTLTFSESVTGLTSGDFTNTGTATGCSFAVSGSGTTYTVTVSGCTDSGTIIPQFASGGATDTAGNGGPASASTSTTPLDYVSQFTVTFNSNGGTGSMSAQSSATAANLTANSFSRTGYTFDGWNTAANGSGTPYANSASYPFTSSTTLYAQWSANTLSVTYDGNNGSAPSGGSSSTTTGATMSSLATSTRAGYTLAGWFTAASGGTQVTTSAGHGRTADFTLYAQWTANTLTVTYDANGGTTPSGGSTSTVTGGTLSSLATTSRTSYTFNGWFTAASGGTQVTTSAGHGQTANFTLYAQWTADFCTDDCEVGDVGPGGGRVFYVDEDGFLCGPTLASICKYLEYAPNTGTSAWSDVALQWTGTSGQTSNLGSTARGTAVGTGYRNTQVIVTQDSTASKAGTLSREYRGPNNLDDWYLPATDELNELCKYARQQTTGDTSVACTSSGSYRAGTGLSRSFPNNYWGSTERNAVQAEVVRFDDGLVTTYMKSASHYVRPIRAFPAVAAPSVTVTYDAQGGSAISSGSAVIGGQIDSSPGTPTRAGYAFNGWFEASSGGTAITFPYTHGESVDFTLYAQWTANTLTVTTTEQGGTLIANASTTTGGTMASPGTPTRTGYAFNGWFEASSGGTAISFPWEHGKTESFTLYAQWTADTLDVTFDEQGGSTIADTTTTTGATFADPGTPTRDGYTFKGWFTASTGGSAITFPWTHGQTADFTLYAQWICGDTCALGDTGPGGGTVFYVNLDGFACGETDASTCTYLEAAPTGFPQPPLWGEGLYNHANALTTARAYRGPNNLTDWYLPDGTEIQLLCKYARGQDNTTPLAFNPCLREGTLRIGFLDEDYWNSSTDGLSRGYRLGLTTVGGVTAFYNVESTKSNSYRVRPIRGGGTPVADG
jgi:uncharacterized repeat protein (TIGR02543 family)